jgi:DNA-binding transcriptional LysR family regulator
VDVIEEGFDVALRIGHLKSSSLIARKIAPVRLVLCAAPSYIKKYGNPTRPEELNNSHFLHYSYMDYSASENPLMKVLRASSQNNQAGLAANNGEILMAAAMAGEGYILQPTFIVGEALKQGKVKTMLKCRNLNLKLWGYTQSILIENFLHQSFVPLSILLALILEALPIGMTTD